QVLPARPRRARRLQGRPQAAALPHRARKDPPPARDRPHRQAAAPGVPGDQARPPDRPAAVREARLIARSALVPKGSTGCGRPLLRSTVPRRNGYTPRAPRGGRNMRAIDCSLVLLGGCSVAPSGEAVLVEAAAWAPVEPASDPWSEERTDATGCAP